MPATITDKFKRILLDDLYASFDNVGKPQGDSDNYYIAIGRSEDWPDENGVPPTPFPDTETTRNFQHSMQAFKKTLDISFVVERQNWSAGSVYVAWSDTHHSDTKIGPFDDIEGAYYVITDENNVYVCLQQGMTDNGSVRNSIYKPTEVTYKPFAAGPDGYIWKFLYNVGTYNSRRYLTSHWMPVEHIEDSAKGGPAADALSASRLAQMGVQLDATPGEILGVEILNGGYGFTSTPTITFNGDYDSSAEFGEAQAYARVDENGEIFQVVMKDSSNGRFRFGERYTDRTWITVSGGGGQDAELRPIIHRDSGGFGFDPRNDLNSGSMMYSVRIIGDEYKVFNVKNDFRQVGLIKNPLKDSARDEAFVGDSYVVGLRGTALTKLYVGDGILDDKTNQDNLVTGLTSKAKAIVDYYDVYVDSDCCDPSLNTTRKVLYVHQNYETGFDKFDSAETVELSDGAGTASLKKSPKYSDIDKYTGTVMYVDNRVRIERDEDQTEDIKIVIEL
jgi:hypothetical protein